VKKEIKPPHWGGKLLKKNKKTLLLCVPVLPCRTKLDTLDVDTIYI
jgi:hypothetical protein